MACIISLSTPDVLIQVTDRRLTWPDGQMFNDYTNKVTVFKGRMAVSYAGLSKVLGQKTDEWLVRILANPAIRTLADGEAGVGLGAQGDLHREEAKVGG